MRKGFFIYVLILVIVLFNTSSEINLYKRNREIPISKLMTSPDEKCTMKENSTNTVSIEENLSLSYQSKGSFSPNRQKRQKICSDVFLTGRGWDQGNDTNSDGHFEILLIIIEFNFTIAGKYSIKMELASNESFSLQVSPLRKIVSDYWSEGVSNVTFPLYPAYIAYSERLETTFQVESIQIKTGINFYASELLVAEVFSVYSTREYSYEEFNVPPNFLNGKYYDEGIDSDGDGLFDYLAIIFEINVTVTGEYDIFTKLIRSDNSQNIFGMSGHTFLSKGYYNHSILFNPEKLFRNKSSSIVSYTIDWILTYYSISVNYTTRTYNMMEFAYPNVEPTGNYWNFGVDQNADGTFDHIVIIVELWVHTTYEFNLLIEMNYVETSYNYTDFPDLDTGVQNVTIQLETSGIYLAFLEAGITEGSIEISFIQITHPHSPTFFYQEILPYSTRNYHINEIKPKSIHIDGNHLFALIAQTSGWRGLGTKYSPYIIEGIIQNGSFTYHPFIEIRNTTVHFEIKNCILSGNGISLKQVQNANLISNEINYVFVGITIADCRDVNLENNKISHTTYKAIHILHGRNIHVRNNFLTIGRTGIEIDESSNVSITDNYIEGFTDVGTNLRGVNDSKIDHNLINENHFGIKIERSLSSEGSSPSIKILVSNNSICNNNEYGLIIDHYGQQNRIIGNDFLGNYPNPNVGENPVWEKSQASENGSDNIFLGNYWGSAGIYSIDGLANNEDTLPLTYPNHLSNPDIIKPNGGEIFTSNVLIHWYAAQDTFSQPINYTLYYSPDGGKQWIYLCSQYDQLVLITGREGYSYRWNIDHTIVQPDSDYFIRVIAEDPFGFRTINDSDSSFAIENAEIEKAKFTPNVIAIFFVTTILIFWLFSKKYLQVR
ncbi:MAG: NosD domain-containing protein [Candidatus Hodarchaeales archaeon]